jgi:TolB protein
MIFKKSNMLNISISLLLFLEFMACTHIDCLNDKGFKSRGKWYRCGGDYKGRKPLMSPDGRKIVFGSARYNLGDIVIINSDGSGWKRLTDTPEYEGDPSFSPDGQKIVFVSERSGTGEIYIMNTDGTEQIRLTISSQFNYEPSFSPDGKRIVFLRRLLDEDEKGTSPQLFIMNADGTDQKRLTYDKSWAGSFSFSPDGKKIIYSTGWHGKDKDVLIRLMDLDNLNITDISDRGDCFSPSFSPDGQKVVFMANWKDKDFWDIYILDLQNYKSNRVPSERANEKVYPESPTFIDNDDKILFLSRDDRKGGYICTINIDGSELKKITKDY